MHVSAECRSKVPVAECGHCAADLWLLTPEPATSMPRVDDGPSSEAESKQLNYVAGKQRFFHAFKVINSAAKLFNKTSPRTAYLLRCNEMALVPEPLGVVRLLTDDTSYINLKYAHPRCCSRALSLVAVC